MRSPTCLLLTFIALVALANAQQTGACRAGIRVRRPFSSLSRQERQAFAQAIMTMKRNGSMDRLTRRHRDGMQYHMTTQFLPMHRAMLVDFEQELVRANPAVTALPYWDELADSRAPLSSSIFTADGLGLMRSGPLSAPDAAASKSRDGGRFNWIPGSASMAAALRGFETFGEMSGVIEIVPHNSYHGLIGGHMGNPSISPADPVFWLHHAYIDLLWATWQGLSARNFVNLETDPSELRVVASAGTVLYESRYTNRDMLYYQQRLCYRYDAVNGNAPRAQRASRLLQELSGPVTTTNSTQPAPGTGEDGASDEKTSVIQGVEAMPEDLIAELMPMVPKDVAVEKVRKAEAKMNAIAKGLLEKVQERLGAAGGNVTVTPEVTEKIAELIPSVQELVSRARKFVEAEVKDDGSDSKIPEVVEQAKKSEEGAKEKGSEQVKTSGAAVVAGSTATACMLLAVVAAMAL
ncbi:hypothetical protein BCR44DRAFT_1516395 [Catenaria anguillulae PL171]|uniref:Tyrosinase copper-binding domain-containing protein n=1 Tax=Catenaria anguillulae PL171 TaxID=765915 RepID=A0A1Y2H970_9FUNG|nr:hypothetical protein BCR44DRAFT_1516395 [Catenaria anguillulae PL171]